MRAAVRTYRVLISVALANMMQYRAVMLLWAAWGIVAPLVSLAVWTAAARGRSLAGFDRAELAGYFLVTMVVSHLTTAWDMEVFSFEVKSGRLSPRLLRPMLPVFQSAADNIAYKLCTAAVLLPIWLAIGVLIRPALHLTVARALWLAPTVVMAAALAFVWGYCVALVAFWTTNIRAINQLYWTGMTFLAGRLAPLALLPPVLRALSWYLPFRWMLSFPVELALGRFPVAQIPVGLAWQVLWLTAGIGAFRLIWAQGIRCYSAVGA
jgi:viologen exporter family transport system permease protein